jgi:hypothetical protein
MDVSEADAGEEEGAGGKAGEEELSGGFSLVIHGAFVMLVSAYA